VAKAKHKRGGGYIRKWEEILSSPAYRDLKPVERCLLEEFQRIFRPHRNGTLSISGTRAAELLNVTDTTALKAFKVLTEHGFIALVRGEYWMERKAREWRLTFEGCNGKEPTDEWRNWEPGQPVASLPQKKPRPQNRGQNCPKNMGRLPQKEGQSLPEDTVSH